MAWKNSRISRASGDAPETMMRTLPPRSVCTRSKTSLRATRFCACSQSGTDSFACSQMLRWRPTARAQSKIMRAIALPSSRVAWMRAKIFS